VEGWIADIVFRAHMMAAHALQKDIARRFGEPAPEAIAEARRRPFAPRGRVRADQPLAAAATLTAASAATAASARAAWNWLAAQPATRRLAEEVSRPDGPIAASGLVAGARRHGLPILRQLRRSTAQMLRR